MPLKKIVLKPGVNRENTRYTTEGGWYDCDKIRFRQGTPEKIGGWNRVSPNTYLGTCRSLWNWSTLSNQDLVSVGTNLKYYIEQSGAYYDVTPLRATRTLTDPFSTSNASSVVQVQDNGHGCRDGDFVTFSNATAVGGLTINGEYQIAVTTADTYNITASSAATSSDTGGGSVDAEYQINIGSAIQQPLLGWGAGGWNLGSWGSSEPGTESIRSWHQTNFGEDLIFGYVGSEIYYWDATNGLASRAVKLSSLSGASGVPTSQNYLLVSDVSRFVFAFGSNDYGSSTVDPMLIRWSDQEDPTNWTPAATNQAGFLRLSNGSRIITATQSRQEVLVWTDAALYSLQYQGAPIVWGAQLVGENISIMSQNATAYSNGIAFWMGRDKFYRYDGRTETLRCDLRQFIFNDINPDQYEQVFAGTNEGFNEVWWFYCSASSDTIDRYVVYNYAEDVWYFGSMARTAWIDSGLRSHPVAATYSNNLVNHEFGVDDVESGVPSAIESYIVSSEFDLDDGHNFMFVWRVLPDLTFRGSTASTPSATMTLLPLQNSGSGYNVPASAGGTNTATINRTAVLPIEEFTGQIFTRVRGRQMAMKVQSEALGTTWQLGSPRVDMRPDGRR